MTPGAVHHHLRQIRARSRRRAAVRWAVFWLAVMVLVGLPVLALVSAQCVLGFGEVSKPAQIH